MLRRHPYTKNFDVIVPSETMFPHVKGSRNHRGRHVPRGERHTREEPPEGRDDAGWGPNWMPILTPKEKKRRNFVMPDMLA